MREHHGGLKNHTRLYVIWKHIRQRCSNPTNARYADYGGRGITFDERWQKFSAFRDWSLANGYAYDRSIDRIDNDGSYSPENCRWVDNIVQARNNRHVHLVEAWGEQKCLSEWAEDSRCVVNYDTLKQRINALGWEPERAISVSARTLAPSTRGSLVSAFGEDRTMRDWASDARCVVSYQTLTVRLRKGWEPEAALTTRRRAKWR